MTRDVARFDVMAELPALRRYGLTLTRDPADAEDLVHDALLRAYERRATFRANAKLRPWLLSILHNCFIDGLRKRRTDLLRLTKAAEIADEHQLPPQEHQIRLAQLRHGFMALPEEQRAALHLVSIEGLSYQEAATALGIPVGTLMSRLGRARAALRAFEEGEAVSASTAPFSRTPQLKIVGGTDDQSA